MNIKVIIAAIFLLVTLIIVTLYVSKNNTGNTEETLTTFPIIETPVVVSEKTFSDLLRSEPDAVQLNVLDNIHLDEFYIYPCITNRSASDVLVLVAQYKPDANGINSFSTAESAVTVFESEMYQNWGHLIYKDAFKPDLTIGSFTPQKVTDPEVLADSYRFTKLSDTKTELYYGWLLNYIVVASSKECLMEGMKTVYHVH